MEILKYLISGFFTIIGALIGYWFKTKDFNLKIIEARLKAADFVSSYRNEVKLWGIEGIKLMDDLVRLVEDDPNKTDEEYNFRKQLFDLKSKISTHIDIGRLFFPNTSKETIGREKPSAYRGFRQPILDALVSAWVAADAMSYKNQSINKIKFYNSIRNHGADDKNTYVINAIEKALKKLDGIPSDKSFSLQTVIIYAKRQFVSYLDQWLVSKDFIIFAEAMAKGELANIQTIGEPFFDEIIGPNQ